MLLNIEKQMVPCKSTAEEVSFEWSHHRISSTDSKVRTTLHVPITDSGSERVKRIVIRYPFLRESTVIPCKVKKKRIHANAKDEWVKSREKQRTKDIEHVRTKLTSFYCFDVSWLQVNGNCCIYNRVLIIPYIKTQKRKTRANK